MICIYKIVKYFTTRQYNWPVKALNNNTPVICIYTIVKYICDCILLKRVANYTWPLFAPHNNTQFFAIVDCVWCYNKEYSSIVDCVVLQYFTIVDCVWCYSKEYSSIVEHIGGKPCCFHFGQNQFDSGAIPSSSSSSLLW